MRTTCRIALAAFAALILANAAMAQVWQPPAEIAPKSTTAAVPPAAAAPEPPAPPNVAQTPKSKEAKAKDCKAQSAAKGLHGPDRKKFIDDCKNS
jgi:hypothetical protein